MARKSWEEFKTEYVVGEWVEVKEGELSENFQPLNDTDAKALNNGFMALVIAACLLIVGAVIGEQFSTEAVATQTEYRMLD